MIGDRGGRRSWPCCVTQWQALVWRGSMGPDRGASFVCGLFLVSPTFADLLIFGLPRLGGFVRHKISSIDPVQDT